jgi:SAM-dependent methyltransferase
MQELDSNYVLDYLNTTKFVGSKNLRILDIGCSDGSFLQCFKNCGELHGMDINEEILNLARNRIDFVSNTLPKGIFFDLILIRGVLHHLPNDEYFWNYLQANLVPGGVVAILANPNSESIVFKLTKSLPALQVNDNFSSNYRVYSPGLVKERLHGLGFTNIKVAFPYLNSPYSKPLIDFPSNLISLLLGRTPRRPFPGNMFNLIATKSSDVRTSTA